MNEVIRWIVEHKEELFAIWSAIVTIASIIIRLIPALPNDSKLLPLIKFVAKYIALNKPTPKSRPI